MRISCVIDSLGAGGAEKVMTLLAGGLAGRGHDVTLTTLDPSAPDFHPAPGNVRRVRAPLSGTPRWFDLPGQFERLGAIRSCLAEQRPDLVISFVDVTNILVLAALPAGSPPVIACEHTDPAHYELPPHWKFLRRRYYPRAAKVVMLTPAALGWAESAHPDWKAAAIANPVTPPDLSPDAPRPASFGAGRNLAAMGRFTGEKGFDLLLRAFAPLAAEFPDWRLVIMGDGPERPKLEALAAGLGLAGRAVLPGRVRKACDALKFADLFVMPSRFEGFGMALAEAMACGLPVISFDCPSGPGLIVRDGVDGLLVPPGDVPALTAAMRRLMSDENARVELAAKAPSVTERFGLKGYLDAWEGLVSAVKGKV